MPSLYLNGVITLYTISECKSLYSRPRNDQQTQQKAKWMGVERQNDMSQSFGAQLYRYLNPSTFTRPISAVGESHLPLQHVTSPCPTWRTHRHPSGAPVVPGYSSSIWQLTENQHDLPQTPSSLSPRCYPCHLSQQRQSDRTLPSHSIEYPPPRHGPRRHCP